MKFYLTVVILFSSLLLFSQKKKQYKIRTIAFYNLENLFDTENDSLTFDDDRTPNGKDRWTKNRYEQKLAHMAKVISEIGRETSKTSPDIVGVCEIENLQVLQDLVNQPPLLNKKYGIVHFDSPDERGIDVALLYKKASFLPISTASHRLLLFNEEGERNYTRDQLVVAGLLDNEQMIFIVNHWPSRSGGAVRSKPNRMAAAKLNKRIIDSVRQWDPAARIISMGDLNDDPVDDSLKKVLRTKSKATQLKEGDLYNPMEQLFKKGAGSLAYRDKWNLFDQLFFTSNLLQNTNGRYRFWKAGVFRSLYLTTKKGRYKGYPFRTYAGGSYLGGYSDHFPVYLYLIREDAALPRDKK